MSTKRGEQERSQAALADERLQGAHEAVADEVAAAEPEMPSVLAAPSTEGGRVAVIKFEKHTRSTMVTVPNLPSLLVDLFPGAPHLPAFTGPPVLGGAARASSNAAFADAERRFFQDSELLTEVYYEDGTTPSLNMLGEVSEEDAESVAASTSAQKGKLPFRPTTPTLASQADIPTQPWFSVLPGAKSSAALQRRSEPKTRLASRLFVWSIAVALSLVVAAWVFFTHKERPKPVAALFDAPPQKVSSYISNDARLPTQPPVEKADTKQASTEKALPPSADADAASADSAASQAALLAALDVPAKGVTPPKPEPMPVEESGFLEGLEAARKYLQSNRFDRFERAKRELEKIQPMLKRHPAHASEFEVLDAISLASLGGRMQDWENALRRLKPHQDAYKKDADYWFAIAAANQMLGYNSVRQGEEKCKALRQAKLAYTRVLTLGGGSRRFKDVSSAIERTKERLSQDCDDNTGN